MTPSSAFAAWHALTLSTSSDNAELCAELLREAGCEGVEVRDCRVQFDQSEDATLVPLPHTEIIGYLHGAATGAESQLRAAFQANGVQAQLQVAALDDEDWANSWRENFPPLRAGKFLVAPPWAEVAPSKSEILLWLDPGLAFGTGQHPTTRLCLELLSELLPPLDAPSLLDVGCGSGILSIAAAKLQPQSRIVACDPDPFCVAASEENARANTVQFEVHERAGAAWTGQQFAVVVANLMSALLLLLAGELAQTVEPGGLLIVSGISSPRAAEVEAALQAAGFTTLQSRLECGERRGEYVERWAAFALHRHSQ